jgi:hypothetical protein
MPSFEFIDFSEEQIIRLMKKHRLYHQKKGKPNWSKIFDDIFRELSFDL